MDLENIKGRNNIVNKKYSLFLILSLLNFNVLIN